jgi:hypothetical protein
LEDYARDPAPRNASRGTRANANAPRDQLARTHDLERSVARSTSPKPRERPGGVNLIGEAGGHHAPALEPERRADLGQIDKLHDGDRGRSPRLHLA